MQMGIQNTVNGVRITYGDPYAIFEYSVACLLEGVFSFAGCELDD